MRLVNQYSSLLLPIALTSGCGTFAARSGGWVDRSSLPKFYPATSLDAGMISGRGAGDDKDKAGWALVGLVDLPFSLVTDTVCLPFDATREP